MAAPGNNAIDSRLVNDIEHVIVSECDLQRRYLSLLEKERSSITKFSADTIESLAQEREELSKKIIEAKDRRVELTKQFAASVGDTSGARLTDLIRHYCRGDVAKRVLTKAAELRSIIESTKREGVESSQVARFALNLVNGLITNIRSATQGVVKTYSRQGSEREQFHATRGRSSTVVTEA